MQYKTRIDDYIIREAVEEDVSLILELIKDLAEYEIRLKEVIATEESLRQSLFLDNKAKVLIGEVQGIPVGFAIYFYNFSSFKGRAGLYIQDLFIKPQFRNNGYGKEMLKILADIAEENNCVRFQWNCLNWNEEAMSFYKKIGAECMQEWAVHRVDIDKIKNLK
ncbi:MAG: GNAT family N-acetyltransferase [Clostridium sp.]|nr:GNAT family N-acetyltransferase [Clostridium sp.]MDY3828875.1 GNAT family N-acetyltransferase [Clostridium sp.]